MFFAYIWYILLETKIRWWWQRKQQLWSEEFNPLMNQAAAFPTAAAAAAAPAPPPVVVVNPGSSKPDHFFPKILSRNSLFFCAFFFHFCSDFMISSSLFSGYLASFHETHAFLRRWLDCLGLVLIIEFLEWLRDVCFLFFRCEKH